MKPFVWRSLFLYWFVLLFFSMSFYGYSQRNIGVLYGVVSDGSLNESLAFANIFISELNLGATTDLDGQYRIPNVPAGTFEVIFSYLGYETVNDTITFTGEDELERNITLFESGLTIEEVVIRGQATGQRAAINQQIQSNTIVNIVSKEKLQELPDQNAAEAVGRLAGVSVYRDAGEGQRISIRGISPRFNSITINGERMPSTEESERSVDLSMLSPDMLAGIELYKAITPDMDGDAIGGTVNFTVRTAEDGFRLNARASTGFNDLKNDFGQWRGVLNVSNRYFSNKLGLIATANYQRANRSNEFRVTDYVYEGLDPDENPILSVDNHNLGDKIETRDRYGGSLTLDFDINKDHSLLLSSNLGKTDRDELRYRRRYRIGNNYQEFDINERDRHITLWSNSLSGNHNFGQFEIDWRTSFSSTDQRTPYEMTGRFRELAAIGSSLADENDLTVVPNSFKHNLANTILYDSRRNKTIVNEDWITGLVDIKYSFSLSKMINGYLKTGVKYRKIKRDRERSGFLLRPYLIGENPAYDDPDLFLTSQGGQILLANFIGTYSNPDFYGGKYDILPGTEALRSSYTTPVEAIDIARYNALFGTDYDLGDQIQYLGHIDIEKINRFYNQFRDEYIGDPFINSGDYNGEESIWASYLMGELNLGNRVTVLGGVRHEKTDQFYTSFRIAGTQDEEEEFEPVVLTRSAGRKYGEWLPMAHLKIEPFDWMDIRAAVTKTLSRPNFFNIVPWEYINTSASELAYGNPELLHMTAWNYDLFLSFYNKFGLFTIGGFYKELKNIDFITRITVTDPESQFKGFSLTEPRNIKDPTNVKGVEFDFQANLRSLTGFWRGIVLGANMTFSESKTFYPLFDVETIYVGPPIFFQTIVTDTLREGPIVGQADMLANVTLGYEKGGFSGRISMIYQSDALSPGNPGIGSSESGVGEIPEKDFFDKGFYRFDLALKQRIDQSGRWTILFNLNNFTNTPERAFLGIIDRLRDEEFYGMTADLGLIYKFNN
jgi:TonB-dependent receptor